MAEATTKTLKLNQQQRLLLATIVGQEPGRTISDTRTCARILDSLSFTEDEITRGIVTSRHIQSLGRIDYSWNVLEETEIELKAEEWAKLRAIIETCGKFTANDLSWLSPVLDQFSL